MAQKKKRKPTVSAYRVLTDPVFERSRENMSEFGRASHANSVLRRAHAILLKQVADRYVSGRLTQIMWNILLSDTVNGRGERTIQQGELSILEGFNFNMHTHLHQALRTHWEVTIDPLHTEVLIDLPTLIPRAMIDASSGADFYTLTGIAHPIDFAEEPFPYEPVTTDFRAVYKSDPEAIQLKCPLSESNGHPIVVSLGIFFYRYINGTFSMVDKKRNALAVIKVIRQQPVAGMNNA